MAAGAGDDVVATGPPLHRLGRRHLGLHAYEKHMPKRLHKLLSQNETVCHSIDSLIPALQQLLEQDDSITSAHLCDTDTRYIGKLKRGIRGEGHNFCGYHNLQMQISYLVQRGSDVFKEGVPSILRLQELIEGAWDMGINDRGRIQTGGIRGTRKHIGTLEAQAVFKSLEIKTRANVFEGDKQGRTAFDMLLRFVTVYFHATDALPCEGESRKALCCVNRPPIYLQRPGHSMTIVGTEMDGTGQQALLVFDTAIAPPKDLKDLSLQDVEPARARELLKPFRRGRIQMQRFPGFETLHLVVDGL